MKKPISVPHLVISGAHSGDLDAIAQHYALETTSGVATFDTAPPPKSYWQTKLHESQQNLYPFLVARSQPSNASSIVCGWAALSRYDSKARLRTNGRAERVRFGKIPTPGYRSIVDAENSRSGQTTPNDSHSDFTDCPHAESKHRIARVSWFYSRRYLEGRGL